MNSSNLSTPQTNLSIGQLMNLYVIRARTFGYDVYQGAVVAAPDFNAARFIHPSGENKQFEGHYNSWVKPDEVHVEFIGVAAEGTQQGVILADFHAG